MEKGDPKVLRFVVLFLREYAGMLQSEFGDAARVHQGTISDCERGKAAPSEEQLRRMATVAGVPWPLVVLLRRFLTALLAGLARRSDPLDLEEASIERAAVEATLLAVAPYRLEEEAAAAESGPSPEEERREAEAIWAALEPLPLAERRAWIELSVHAARSRALAERIGLASEQAGAHDPEEALALADLARSIRERAAPTAGRDLETPDAGARPS